MLPVSVRNKIEMVGEPDKRDGNIVLGLRKTRNAQKSVFYEEVKCDNFLSLKIKRCDRLKLFKRELKEYIISSYFGYINRLVVD